MNFHSINWIYIGVVALALIIVIYAWADKRRRKSLAEFASAKLLPNLSQTISPTKVLLKKILFALGVFAIFVAIARPQWGYRWEETKSKGIDIIFAIDTSKSMLAEDVKPSRLDRAKLAVLDLLNVLNGDRIGIVAFSGQAFLQCPLTLDYDAFRMSLEALDTNVIQRGGTNIASAIDEAEIAFSNTSNKKVIVLISDGEELEASAIDKAKQASKNDVIIYSLGVGGTKGEAIPVRDASGRLTQLRDENGKIVTSKLNEKVLSEIAKITGGFYEPLTANGMDIIYEDGLKKIPQHELSARMKQLAIERFQIPLAIAIVLIALESLIGTRKFFARRRKISNIAPLLAFALLPAFVFAPQGLRAETTLPQEQSKPEKIEQTKVQTKEEKSDEEKINLPENPTARDYFNTAIDLSAKGDKQKAKEFFETSMKMSPEDFGLHAKAFYNMGNIDYVEAKHSLATAETSESIAQKVAQADGAINMAMSQGSQLLKQGAPLLQQEQDALKKAKSDEEKKKVMQNSPLKNQQFQQQLKQGISMCDGIEKGFDELKKSSTENSEKWENAMKILDNALGDYNSALSLDPSFSDAKKNLSSALDAQKNLQKQIDQNKKISDALNSEVLKQRLTNLAKMKEELKKLVRDDNNQNKDNQQNQDQNQQNQNQQNQNQQNQNNQQNQQDQNKQNQDKNQQNQNKQDKQDNKDNQNKQDKNQQDKNKQDKQNQDKQNQDQQNQDKNQQNQQDKKDGSQDKQPDEQAVENKPEQQKADEQKSGKDEQKSAQDKKEDKKEKQGEQPQEMPVEQKKGEKKDASASQGEKSEKQNENFRASVGAMTKGEAKQLLESMKDSDKILPLRGYGEQKDRFEKSYKDW